MAYELPAQAQTYIRDHKQELVELVKALCAIPAPSNQEQRRAAFCKDWLEKAGCTGVYIDDALNVVYPVNAESSDQLTLFTAHLDTVFPDLEPLPMEEKDGILHCPGVGDPAASGPLHRPESPAAQGRLSAGVRHRRGGPGQSEGHQTDHAGLRRPYQGGLHL